MTLVEKIKRIWEIINGDRSRCLYCRRLLTLFTRREHVVPSSMSKFEPLNPTLLRGIVCDHCNNKVFSLLEAKFKEDSEEGIFCQMLNLVLKNNDSVRVRGINAKVKFKYPFFKKGIMTNVFPFFKIQNNKLVVIVEQQVIIRDYFNGYQVYPIQALKVAKEVPSKYKKIKKRFKDKKMKLYVFAGAEHKDDSSHLDSSIKLLADYGIKYNEKARNFTLMDNPEQKDFEFEGEFTVDKDIGRVLAKTVFNYFTYCCYEEGLSHIPYSKQFNGIRKFIKGDEKIKLKDIVVDIKDSPILFEEAMKNRRLIAHTIVFEKKNDSIIARVSLFGRRIYEIKIGTMLSELDKDGFGCGHLFYPIDKSINNLAQNLPVNPTEEQIKTSFGLFKSMR